MENGNMEYNVITKKNEKKQQLTIPGLSFCGGLMYVYFFFLCVPYQKYNGIL